MTLNEEKILKEYIKNIIRESYSNSIDNDTDLLDEKETKSDKKSKSRKDIKEKLHNLESNISKLNSHKSKKSKEKDSSNSEGAKNKRSRVINKLKNPETNCAELMRKLWKPSQKEEDGLRSYFYKCRDGELNDSGVPYKFSDNEINRLYHLLSSPL